MDRQRWSHSKLIRLLRCGEAFRRDEEEREFAPPSSGMVRGTVVHAMAALSHTKQIAAKAKHPDLPKSVVLREALPSEEEVADLAASKFELERRGGIVAEKDEEDQDLPDKVVIGRDKDSAVRMSRYLVSRVAPFVDPIAVEQKLVVEPKDSDIRISGVLDLVTEELTPDGGVVRRGIRDYKTGRRAPNETEASTSGQLSMYALLDSLATGRIADVFALDHLVEGKRFASPYLVTQETTRSQEDIDVMVDRLNNAIDAVRAGIFIANGVGQWYCAPKWCRYYSTCKFISGRVRNLKIR